MSLFDEVHDDGKVAVLDGDVEGRPGVDRFCVVATRVDRCSLVQKVSHDLGVPGLGRVPQGCPKYRNPSTWPAHSSS